MNKPAASLSVSIVESTVFLRISGRANFTSSIDFKRLVQELSQKGYKHFVLDLSECLIMDSTFLGVLAGIGLKMSHGGNPESSVELLNPNSRVTELLENLGVSHLFSIRQGDSSKGESFQPSKPTGAVTTEEVTRTCLEAHRTLMGLNPDNVVRFKDVAEFLAEDLKRLQSRQST